MLNWVEWPYKGCVSCNFGDIFQENVHLGSVRPGDMQDRAFLMDSEGKSAAKDFTTEFIFVVRMCKAIQSNSKCT